MKIVCFLDLDDTIFQTLPKCPADGEIRTAAFHRDGTPLSFTTERQRAILDMLLRSATVIPTTARNLDAFRRVELKFDSFAILNFGGVVLLPDGALDKIWDAQVRPKALDLASELHVLHRAVERFIAEQRLGATARVISDFDMPLYLVVKHPQGDAAKLRRIRDFLEWTPAHDFFLHANDNNLSVAPRFLGKEHAVQHVLQNHFGTEPVLTIGMGDSLSDAPFMRLCDYSMVPRGQLYRRLFEYAKE